MLLILNVHLERREKGKEDKWIGGVTNKEKYGIDRRIIT